MKKFPTGRLLKDKFIRMRESLKRFVQTWICFIWWSRILTTKRFVSFCDWRTDFIDSQIWFLNSNCGLDSWLELPKIRPVFTNPTNPHESWRILSTIAQNESLQIQAGRLVNPDSQIRTLKICIVDSFHRPVFQRFDLFSQIQRILTNPDESLVL